MTQKEENRVNAVGDKLAEMLEMSVNFPDSPDNYGRTRWKTRDGTKTGLGLLRTILRFLDETETRNLE